MTTRAKRNRVRRYLAKLGVSIEIKEDFNSLGNCPFDSDVNLVWSRKVIQVTSERWETLDADLISVLIHEAGHAVACKRRPNQSSEWPFFGWEYAVARRCRVVKDWLQGHKDYYADLGRGEDRVAGDMGQLTPKEVRQVLDNRWLVAQKSGLIVDAVPLVLR